MKILFIGKDLSLGGGEKLIVNTVNSLKKTNIEIDLAIFNNKNDFKYEKNIRIIPIQKYKSISGLNKLLFFPSIMSRLISLAKGYDLLLSFERFPFYFNFLVSRLLNKPSALYIQTPLVYSQKGVHLIMHRVLLRYVDHILVVSEGIRDEITNVFGISPSRITLIPPSISPKKITEMAKIPLKKFDIDRLNDKKVIINIGRLHEQKNQALLINSFFYLSQKDPNVILLIIGEGKEKERLEALITKLHLKAKVILLGKMENPYPYLVLSEVFVLTSQSEGLPHVLLEALFFKKPMVVIDSWADAKKLLDDSLKYAILIPENTKNIYQILAHKIEYLLKEKKNSKYLNAEFQKSVQFNEDKIIKKWANFFQKNNLN